MTVIDGVSPSPKGGGGAGSALSNPPLNPDGPLKAPMEPGPARASSVFEPYVSPPLLRGAETQWAGLGMQLPYLL